VAKKRTNSKTAEIAAPIRDFLKEAIKQKIRTKADQEALAKYLGQAPTSVTNLLKGEGGLDTWVAAI
jgi:plasmid maintenance system antidote protein VapI